ncbi:type II toxin-antitoxin system RelE/ParE family toxin [Stratiformator vulcanicus]|uniref:Plasmid stabilization system protein n=1 Tax=Stratiformator vulcanicus TaxID=2527980 RepID=A0A517R6G6_9PLAN|nr:type II toxin-antitoxin system RelE/ParE family toxin [Stratiformator vulcanicus]QDT39435.1 Plasmid stabilization system protein [Stratiformator vulcanicus]
MIRRRPQVEIDLFELADFIAASDFDAAIRFINAAEDTIDKLGGSPSLGNQFLHGPVALEMFRFWRIDKHPHHLIFYISDGEEIEIVRVLHSSRDIGKALAEVQP